VSHRPGSERGYAVNTLVIYRTVKAMEKKLKPLLDKVFL
jgi:hypothetical protein